jgi:hypothetical protein
MGVLKKLWGVMSQGFGNCGTRFQFDCNEPGIRLVPRVVLHDTIP